VITEPFSDEAVPQTAGDHQWLWGINSLSSILMFCISGSICASKHCSTRLQSYCTVLLTTIPVPQALSCLPRDWLDVLQHITTYLQEVTTRFSSSLQQNPDTLEAAKTLAVTLATTFQQYLPKDGPAARGRTTEWRRLLTSLSLLQRQLNAQQDTSRVVEQLQAMQAKQQAQQAQQQSAAASGAAGSSPGPGELHPSGPRHDNDKVRHLEISVAPTRQEVLCTTRPFLLCNRCVSCRGS
jgi:hypothetical protein